MPIGKQEIEEFDSEIVKVLKKRLRDKAEEIAKKKKEEFEEELDRYLSEVVSGTMVDIFQSVEIQSLKNELVLRIEKKDNG